MASREHAKPPAPASPELQRAMEQSETVRLADTVAAIAHGAIGQWRADHITPYIDHPRRAATLIVQWNEAGIIDLDAEALERCTAGALLHDVLEDTKLPRSELRAQFPNDKQLLALVERMTEPPGDPDAPEYYRSIGTDRETTIVKCADRCANLEDVIKDVKRGESVDRWRRYVQKTKRDVLPLLREKSLREQLESRVEEIETALRTAAR